MLRCHFVTSTPWLSNLSSSLFFIHTPGQVPTDTSNRTCHHHKLYAPNRNHNHCSPSSNSLTRVSHPGSKSRSYSFVHSTGTYVCVISPISFTVNYNPNFNPCRSCSEDYLSTNIILDVNCNWKTKIYILKYIYLPSPHIPWKVPSWLNCSPNLPLPSLSEALIYYSISWTLNKTMP